MMLWQLKIRRIDLKPVSLDSNFESFPVFEPGRGVNDISCST